MKLLLDLEHGNEEIKVHRWLCCISITLSVDGFYDLPTVGI